ncbi:hypothetical protein TWF718_002611 [Orbilia javanica]|uniref:Uncharacterized protein n=1 Tax=Orbilia javanica TaxID=47235 RepID=A0AAN8MUH5_9PEZI
MNPNYYDGFSGQEGIDPNDSRYAGISYPPGGMQPQGNYNFYPNELDIDGDGPEYQNNQYSDHPGHDYSYQQHYTTNEGYASPVSSNPSTYYSRGWDTSSRDFSSQTTAEDIFAPAQAGHRCIFYWVNCQFKANDHDDWVEHIYYCHFESEERSGRADILKLGNTPVSWTCRFRGCGTVVRNDDHRAMWDEKLAHIFGHFKNDHARPEQIQEDIAWLKYYQSMGLCNAVDVYGGVFHPPAQKPYSQGIQMWRKMPRKLKEYQERKLQSSSEDAPGEPVRSIPTGPPGGGYVPPTPYHHPLEQQQPYHQHMNTGTYPPPPPPPQASNPYPHYAHHAPY